MQKSLQKLTIQEVRQRLDISKHTLRFWEKELDGIIKPLRTKGGQRRYTLEHLSIIEEIKGLKRKGMSLFGIKKKLNNNYKDNDEETETQEVDILAHQIAEIVRRQSTGILREINLFKLTPPNALWNPLVFLFQGGLFTFHFLRLNFLFITNHYPKTSMNLQ